MKKDFIYVSVLLAVVIVTLLLKATGLAVHIMASVIGMLALAAYTAVTKKEWKLLALEIIMRVFYGVALITGIVVMNASHIVVLQIAHRASVAMFVVLLVVLFAHKLINKKLQKIK